MKNRIIVILLFLLQAAFIYASDNARFAGSYTRLGLGARSISMGNTGVAAPARGYSMYYNPALAGRSEQKIASVSYNFMSLDRHILFVGYTMKVPPGAGLSLGWLKSGIGELFSYNSIGQETGKINQSAHAIYGSFSRHFSDKLSIGVTIKVLLEYINDGTDDFDYSSKGVGGDVGVLYVVNDNLRLGGVIKDIGSKLKANTEDLFERGGTTIDKFPQQYRIGAFYTTPYHWLNVAYDFEWSNKGESRHHIGLEAIHGRNLALRMGVNGSQFVAGTGFDFKVYTVTAHLDYAFISSVVDEGSSHLFSWEFYF